MSRERNLTVEEWQQIQERQRHVPIVDLAPKVADIKVDPNATKVKRPGNRMNKTEYAYSLELEARRQAGEILWWGYEKITLKLADDCRFTPDFTVLLRAMLKDCTMFAGARFEPVIMQFHEIKGFLRGDADVKFRVAAEQFPWAEFFMYRKQKGGGWELMKHLNGGAR